jgi:hypothetical protein
MNLNKEEEHLVKMFRIIKKQYRGNPEKRFYIIHLSGLSQKQYDVLGMLPGDNTILEEE